MKINKRQVGALMFIIPYVGFLVGLFIWGIYHKDVGAIVIPLVFTYIIVAIQLLVVGDAADA